MNLHQKGGNRKLLHIEKTRMRDTVKIKIKNRLFYVLVLDGLSLEESTRLWQQMDIYVDDCLNISKDSICNFIHYLWWERQKVAILFITGDAMDTLKQSGIDVNVLRGVLDDFEEEQIRIPFCSLTATDFNTSLKDAVINTASRVNIYTNDNTGEFSITTSEEIFQGAFRI